MQYPSVSGNVIKILRKNIVNIYSVLCKQLLFKFAKIENALCAQEDGENYLTTDEKNDGI